jgi:hypothetical protein
MRFLTNLQVGVAQPEWMIHTLRSFDFLFNVFGMTYSGIDPPFEFYASGLLGHYLLRKVLFSVQAGVRTADGLPNCIERETITTGSKRSQLKNCMWRESYSQAMNCH